MPEKPITQGNLILFRCDQEDRVLYLRLESTMDFTLGIEPDVWRFSLEASELEAVDFEDQLTGVLELYNSVVIDPSGPAIAIRAVIVDFEAQDLGVPHNPEKTTSEDPLDSRTVVPVSYSVSIADFRAQFTKHRGGLLTMGQVNQKPINEGKQTDDNGAKAYSNSQLAGLCLAKMGFTTVNDVKGPLQASVPATLNDAPRMTDLDWKVAFPSEELGRIVKSCGHVIVPTFEGGLKIVLPDVDLEPDLQKISVLSNVALGSLDRRPRRLLITSAPNAIRVTRRFYGVWEDGLEYCFLDFNDGRFKRQSEISYLANVNLLKELATNPPFKDVPPLRINDKDMPLQSWLTYYAFRCVRLNPDLFPGVRFLPYTFLKGKRIDAIVLWAKIASFDPTTGLFSYGVVESPVRVTDLLDHNRVLVTRFTRLLNLSPNAPDQQSERENMQLLGPVGLYGDLTYEEVDAQGGKRHFEIGFDGYRGAFEVIDPEQYEGFKPTFTVSHPELVCYDDRATPDSNRDALIEQAAELTKYYLPRENKARLITAFGFAGVPLSSRVAKISIAQSPPLTKVFLDDVASLKAGGFNPIATNWNSENDRRALHVGEHAPVSLVLASGGEQQAASGPSVFYVKLAQSGGSNGGLATKPSYRYIVRDSGDRVLGTDVIPAQQRPNGSHLPAETGIARYKSDGSIMLVWCDEVPDTGECDIG